MVLRGGMLLATIGIAIGVGASLAVGQLLRGVFESQVVSFVGDSVLTYALVVPALVAVTLLAAYLPARRAARIDPLRALRQD
jgi:putative ABC transport system permease protein